MTHIVHLLGSPDEQTRQIHALAVREMGPGFSVETQTIGPGGSFRNLPVAILRLRRARPDVTHAWGIPALAAAVVAGHARILFSPDRFAGPGALRWVRTLMDRAEVTMVCPTFTQQRLAVSRGLAPDRCRVIPPGVDFGAVRQRRDSKLRAELGLAEHDFVLLAPGESSFGCGHELATWTAGILHFLDSRYKLLIWGRGRRAEAIADLGRRFKQPLMITLAEQKLGRSVAFEDLLAVADLCLATAAGTCPTLPIAAAMAGGVPIVSTVNYVLAELLEDRHTALMVPSRSPRALTQRVLDLAADPALRAKLTDTARAEAYEHFSMTRMMEGYRQLVRELL